MWAFEVWQEGLRVASGIASTEEEARKRAAQYEGAVHIDFKANRLNNLKIGFTDWIHEMPPWPEGVPEVIGPTQRKVSNDEVLYLQRNVHRIRKQRLSRK